MKEIHKFVLAGVLCGASCLFTYAQELYKNENAPVHERVADLLSRLTVEEKISLLRATSPGIPRLGITRDTEPLTSDDLCDRRAFLGVGACLPDGDELAAVLGRLAGIGDPLVLYGFDV